MTPAPGRIRRFRDHWRARRDGKRDGVIGIPTAHEPSPPPALVEIAQRAAEALAELVQGSGGERPRVSVGEFQTAILERLTQQSRGLRTKYQTLSSPFL